jgi:predicted N-acyltransferase
MCFKSKRRITIRRERQKVQVDADIRIDAVVGKDILKCEGLVQRMFEIYRSTIDKMFWGNQYLSLDFFNLLAKSDFIDNICFMCARRRSSGEPLKASDVIAGTFNVVKDGVFYGRYWGCLEEVKNLHFETCYWSAIDYCIQNGLRRMEPGAGGGGKLRCQMMALYLVHVIGELTRRP